jgi:hypothetical protein
MSKYLPYIMLVVGAALCFFIMRGCNKSLLGPSDEQRTHFVDSVVGIKRDSLQKVFNDSLSYVKDSATKVVDSFKAIVASDRYNNQVTTQELEGLIAAGNSAKNKKDTSGQLTNCDSLRDVATAGIALVKKTMQDRDNLDSAYKGEIKLRDDANGRLNSMLTQSNQQLFSVGIRYDSLYADYKKINTKPKHWSIGPGAGVALINGKAQPILQFGIVYSLFKF